MLQLSTTSGGGGPVIGAFLKYGIYVPLPQVFIEITLELENWKGLDILSHRHTNSLNVSQKNAL